MGDRRDTIHIDGQDPAEIIEETPEVNLSYRRAYHIRADVYSVFAAHGATPTKYHIQADVESVFKSEEGSWTNALGIAEAFHTELDVNAELFEDDA